MNCCTLRDPPGAAFFTALQSRAPFSRTLCTELFSRENTQCANAQKWFFLTCWLPAARGARREAVDRRHNMRASCRGRQRPQLVLSERKKSRPSVSTGRRRNTATGANRAHMWPFRRAIKADARVCSASMLARPLLKRRVAGEPVGGRYVRVLRKLNVLGPLWRATCPARDAVAFS